MTRHATPQEALAAALRSVIAERGYIDLGALDAVFGGGNIERVGDDIIAALAQAGYTIVRSDDLLEIAGIAGADLSDIDHAGQLVHPPLLDYVATEVRALRQSYDECLKECE